MAVISISSGLSGKGKEIADRLAKDLGYETVSREVLLKASEQFNIPEIKLTRAIENAPTILDRFSYGKEKYVAYIRNAILARLERDNVIYRGLAGHFFLQGISHVLKVQIVSRLEDRIKKEMTEHNTGHDTAKKMIQKDDDERRKWSQHLYKVDPQDPNLYDLVINLENVTEDEAVEIIKHTLGLQSFKSTDASRKQFADRLLESKVMANLVEVYPTAQVHVVDETLHVGLETGNFSVNSATAKIKELLGEYLDEIELKVTVSPILEAS